MSNNPHQSRSAQEQQSLQWQAPVALQTADAEQDSSDLYAGDHESSGLHPTGHGEGPGLASELVLTAIIALGVTLATCSALYFGGAFSAGAHHSAPSAPHAPSTPSAH